MTARTGNAYVFAIQGIPRLTVIKMDIRPHRRRMTYRAPGGGEPGEFPAMGILVGVLPALLLVVTVIVFRRRQR